MGPGGAGQGDQEGPVIGTRRGWSGGPGGAGQWNNFVEVGESQWGYIVEGGTPLSLGFTDQQDHSMLGRARHSKRACFRGTSQRDHFVWEGPVIGAGWLWTIPVTRDCLSGGTAGTHHCF